MAMARPSIASELPPPYNPLCDDKPIPDPKEPRRYKLRDMTPLEQSILGREVSVQMLCSRKRDGCRRIVWPLDWWKPGELAFDIQDMSSETHWKLWHFARLDKPIQSVLSADEMAASKPPIRSQSDSILSFRRSRASLQSSTVFMGSPGAPGDESPAPPASIPLDAEAARLQLSDEVSALASTKHARDQLVNIKRQQQKKDSEFEDSDDPEEEPSDSVAAANDAAAVEDGGLFGSDSEAEEN